MNDFTNFPQLQSGRPYKPSKKSKKLNHVIFETLVDSYERKISDLNNEKVYFKNELSCLKEKLENKEMESKNRLNQYYEMAEQRDEKIRIIQNLSIEDLNQKSEIISLKSQIAKLKPNRK